MYQKNKFHTFKQYTHFVFKLNIERRKNYAAISLRREKILGIQVNYSDKYNEEQTHYLTCNNPYFQMIGKAINLDIPVRDLFDRNEHDRKQVMIGPFK